MRPLAPLDQGPPPSPSSPEGPWPLRRGSPQTRCLIRRREQGAARIPRARARGEGGRGGLSSTAQMRRAASTTRSRSPRGRSRAQTRLACLCVCVCVRARATGQAHDSCASACRETREKVGWGGKRGRGIRGGGRDTRRAQRRTEGGQGEREGQRTRDGEREKVERE